MTTNTSDAPSIQTPEAVPFADKHGIHSAVLAEERTILVRVPESYQRGTQRYPVLYMLDGELPRFTSHVGVVIQLSECEAWIPEMIVVGIPNTDRPRDMLPVAMELPNGRKHGGGADRFLQFLATELVPAIDRAYRTHPYRILSGTSASGLAVAYAMASGLAGFQVFFASSPTVGWSERALFARVESEGIAGDTGRFFAVFTGDADMEGVQDDCRAFYELVRSRGHGQIDVRHWVHEGERHCPFDGFRRSLLALYECWQPSDDVLDGGLNAVRAHYQRLSEMFGYPIDVPISSYESVGERLIASGNASTAAEFLSAGLDRFKGSTRIAFYLAIALARTGQRQAARDLLDELVSTERPGNNRLQVLLNQLTD